MDIVDEDNKTIIHKAAARAEQHNKLQHQLLQQQKQQHQHAQHTAQSQSSSPSTISPSGPSGRPSQSNSTTSFSFAQGCGKMKYMILAFGGSLVRFVHFN
jgi:hypothetical protein